MKFEDIRQLEKDGLISSGQAATILDAYQLRESKSRLPIILTWIAVGLVTSGLALVVAHNWDGIPGLVRIASGLIVMVAIHCAGYHLRSTTGKHPFIGDLLHFVAGCLFLCNIAIIGQVYNLSSREPDAFLLWMVALSPLPWVLRSKALYILFMSAFTIWACMESFCIDGFFHQYEWARNFQILGTLGLLWMLIKHWIEKSSYAAFSGPTLKVGWGLLNAWFLFLCFGESWGESKFNGWVAGMEIFLAAAFVIVTLLQKQQTNSVRLWGIGLGLVFGVFGVASSFPKQHYDWEMLGWAASAAIFILSLLGAAAGLGMNSKFIMRGSLLMVCIVVIHRYFTLFADLLSTGLLFISTGAVLLIVGYAVHRYTRLIQTKS